MSQDATKAVTEATMKTDLIDVSTAVGTSGIFLRLARDGQLQDVSSLVIKRMEVVIELVEVENLLVVCNDPTAISGFAAWCIERQKNFIKEFVKRVAKLQYCNRERRRLRLTFVRSKKKSTS
jgi:hypothetical protein